MKTVLLIFLLTILFICCTKETEIEKKHQIYNSKNNFIYKENSDSDIVVEGVLISKQINSNDLKYKSRKELRYIRNAIFAKYGYIFKDKKLNKYFSRFEWYTPKTVNVNQFLTEYDKTNLKLIRSYEEKIQRATNLLKFKDTNLVSYTLPTTVNNFVKILNKPDSIFIDKDDLCPLGKFYFWRITNLNLELIFGIEYSNDENNNSSNLNFIALRSIIDTLDSKYISFLGIKIRDSEFKVESKLEEFIKNNPEFYYERRNFSQYLNVVLDYKYSYFFILTNTEKYFYFIIDHNFNVICFAQSTVDISMAS